MRSASEMRRRCRGQATVEAAFALPIVMLLVLLLLQPGILLYDRIAMAGAAAEGCRVLTTASAGETGFVRDYVLRRLSAVPQADIFHVHSTGCTWQVALTGDEAAADVSVAVSTEVQLLPLIGSAAALAGMASEDGHVVLSVESSAKTQPDWVDRGSGPADWIGSWA